MDNQSNKKLMDQMLVGAWITQGIYIAAELGIADLLVHGSKTAEELAIQTSTNSDALYRVLRALASIGIFSENEQGYFELTPLAEYLRSDHPDSCRAFSRMTGTEFYQSWGQLLLAVQTGKEVITKIFGKTFFQYLAENPERHRIYDAAMANYGVAETQPTLDAYDFSQFQTVVDIGGGNSQFLTAILKQYPGVKGVLFDLPAVADSVHPILKKFGLSDRCQFVGGDFFISVPEGYDAYILKHIIHDWSDKDAISILLKCREAMKPKSKILLVETVIPDGNVPCFGKWLDLMMLIIEGRERTEEQYRNLFSQVGLKLNRIIPTAHEVSVIEGVL